MIDKITVGYKEFIVTEHEKIDNDDPWGQALLGERKLKLKKGLIRQDKIETLIHEIFHIYLFQSGFYGKLGEADTELAINFATSTMMTMLYENPELFNLIKGALK